MSQRAAETQGDEDEKEKRRKKGGEKELEIYIHTRTHTHTPREGMNAGGGNTLAELRTHTRSLEFEIQGNLVREKRAPAAPRLNIPSLR